MKMVKYELKKIFSKFTNKIILALLFLVLIITIYFAVSGVTYVDENGISQKGLSAVRQLKETKNQWSGPITVEKLRDVLDANASIISTEGYQSKDILDNDKAYSKRQGFSDLRDLINRSFGGMQDYDYYKADSISSAEVDSFYENRISNLKNWLETDAKDSFSQAEKDFLIQKYEELKTPLYYESSDGWKQLLQYSPTVIMLFVLITGFLVSGIFSNEFQLKADSIFFSSKLGRTKAIRSKAAAGFATVTVTYFIIMLLYTAAVLGILGADGAGCAVQASSEGWKCFHNITWLQEYLLVLAGGYIGSLLILTITMLISASTHSSVFAVTFPFIIVFIPSFASSFPQLSKFLGLFPDQLLQMNMAVQYFNLYQIGGHVMSAVPILFTLYLVLCIILFPLLYQIYKKAEIA